MDLRRFAAPHRLTWPTVASHWKHSGLCDAGLQHGVRGQSDQGHEVDVHTLMSRHVVSATPQTTIRAAAAQMLQHDVGVLPVLSDGVPVGIVTDRDLVVRVLSAGTADAGTPIREAMSPAPAACFADQDVAEAAAMMGDLQIRRLLVLDRSGELVGLISLGDIAENASEELAGQALGEIAEDR